MSIPKGVEEWVDSFLAEHCTQMDDHDAKVCQKCAEMRAQLLKAIEVFVMDRMYPREDQA